jgi:DNA polymerase-3 subunit delta'
VRFSELIGHDKIKDILIRSANTKRIGHAYIFEGQDGVGRLSAAKAFAQRMICENPLDGDACGVCTACCQCQRGNHPDRQVVTNQLYDASKKSTDILVDTIRSMKRDIYIKPYAAERKVYIVPKADTMNVYAQNSLLKVLEEPPEYCVIILIAENSNMFLPTILSRAPILKFYPLHENEVKEYLVRNFSDPDKIDIAAKMSGGSIGKAKQLLENTDIMELRDDLLEHVSSLLGSRRKSIYDLALFLKQNKDEIDFLMGVLQDFFRDLMYIKKTEDETEIKNPDKKVKIKKIADALGDRAPLALLEIVFKYSDYFAKNISYGLNAQCLSLELWEAINDRGYRSKV